MSVNFLKQHLLCLKEMIYLAESLCHVYGDSDRVAFLLDLRAQHDKTLSDLRRALEPVPQLTLVPKRQRRTIALYDLSDTSLDEAFAAAK